jgi:hypothetical protein
MASDRNYLVADIPDDLPPDQFNAHQRRADILQKMIDAGHPYGIKQSKLAKLYGVSQQIISRDVKEIQSYLSESLGDYAVSLTQTAFENIYNSFMRNDDKEKAWRVLMDWNKWLENRGALKQTPKTIAIESRVKDMSKAELMEMLDALTEETDSE